MIFYKQALMAKKLMIFLKKSDGKKIKISTAPAELADVLTKAYNRGGFTDVSIQRVPLGEKNVTENADYLEEK